MMGGSATWMRTRGWGGCWRGMGKGVGRVKMGGWDELDGLWEEGKGTIRGTVTGRREFVALAWGMIDRD